MVLPIIDFSPFLDPSSTPAVKRSTALKIDRVYREIELFYLLDHSIDNKLLQNMLNRARTFFEKASPEEKQGLAIKDASNRIGDSSHGF
jgi:isopenicillin N synthase-like dioxygenase